MTAFHPGAAPLPSMAIKSYAAHRCWKDATPAGVTFHPISKKDAARIWHDARELERRTAVRRVDAFGHVHIQGDIGRCGLAVLHALIYDFLNWRSGRLDPSHAAIARRAIVSISSVTKALRRLKAAGVINWIQRCTPSYEDGRYTRSQDTNAYAILPSTGWRGFWKAPPAPDRDTWGAAPPIPAHLPMELEEATARLAEVRARMSKARPPPH